MCGGRRCCSRRLLLLLLLLGSILQGCCKLVHGYGLLLLLLYCWAGRWRLLL
jgi:hypothetical protein